MTQRLRRHLAAVMFTDVAGYTALMQKDEAAALRTRQRHRSALEEATEGRHGEVLQYFGDGSMSVFDSSLEAVEAAIDIQKALDGDPLLRIGLHIGDIAYDPQGAYGDAVNIAARLEAICPPGGVTISQKVYDEIRRHPDLSVVPSGTVRLKNIDQAVQTYALAVDGLAVPVAEPGERTDDADPDEGPEGATRLPVELVSRLEALARRSSDPLERLGAFPGRVPLVAREAEVDLLRRALESAEAGQGAAVFLRGPRGVGKTRLAREVAEHARARGWSVLSGRAHPSERLVPYAPFSDALMPLLRGLDPEVLAELTPGTDAALCALFPALGQVPRSTDLGLAGPGESRTRLYWQFASMLATLAAHRPLLVTLEDLDFADRSSLELFQFVARQARSEPILFIVEYTGADPERRQVFRELEQSLVADGTGKVLEIEPLDERGTEAFIAATLDLEGPEAGRLAETVHGWARGNPFFTAGTLRGLVDSGALTKAEGRWNVGPLDTIELPHTVRDAVLVWMAQLSEPALDVARYLAMIGREVEYELVRWVTGLGDEALSAALDELVRHQLVSESESQWTLGYAFRNPIIREVLRGEIGLSRRRELHGRIATSLEALYADTADEHADELAYHYGRAHPGTAGPKALRYLVAAGEAALTRHASREAVDYLQEALDRTEAIGPNAAGLAVDVDRARILHGLARARRRLGDVAGGVALWRRLMAEAREGHRQGDVAALHREIGLTFMAGGHLEEAIEELGAAVEWASASGNVPLVVRSQLAQAQCFHFAGRTPEAAAVMETGLTLAQEFGRPGLLAQVYRSMTQLKFWTGHIAEAREAAQRALELAETSGDRGVAFWSRWAMGALEGLVGNTAAMAEYVDAAGRIADEVGSPLYRLATDELRLELHWAHGQWIEGLALGRRAVDMARSTDGKLILPRLLVWLSFIHIGRGELDQADRLTREAWEASGAERAGDVASFVDLHAVVPAHIGRAACALAHGDWTEAIRLAEAGLRIADRSGYIVWSIHHLLPIIAEAAIHARDLERASKVGGRMRAEAERLGHPLGLAWAAAIDAVLTWLENDATAGARSLREGARAMESIPLVYDAARLRRQLAGRLAEIGEREAAIAELERAHAVFHRLGARPELEKARGLFQQIGTEAPDLGPIR